MRSVQQRREPPYWWKYRRLVKAMHPCSGCARLLWKWSCVVFSVLVLAALFMVNSESKDIEKQHFSHKALRQSQTAIRRDTVSSKPNGLHHPYKQNNSVAWESKHGQPKQKPLQTSAWNACLLLPDTNFIGHDFSAKRAKTGAACCTMCRAELKCTAFTFVNGGCYMKSNVRHLDRRKMVGATSAILAEKPAKKSATKAESKSATRAKLKAAIAKPAIAKPAIAKPAKKAITANVTHAVAVKASISPKITPTTSVYVTHEQQLAIQQERHDHKLREQKQKHNQELEILKLQHELEVFFCSLLFAFCDPFL